MNFLLTNICQYDSLTKGDMLSENILIGSELCTAVETIYSMSYLYHTLGDNYFADRCERAAFNALPVSITANHWGHQYLAVASEPYVKILSGENPFWNVGNNGLIYGFGKNVHGIFCLSAADRM